MCLVHATKPRISLLFSRYVHLKTFTVFLEIIHSRSECWLEVCLLGYVPNYISTKMLCICTKGAFARCTYLSTSPLAIFWFFRATVSSPGTDDHEIIYFLIFTYVFFLNNVRYTQLLLINNFINKHCHSIGQNLRVHSHTKTDNFEVSPE